MMEVFVGSPTLVKLFKIGRSQAFRVLREFELPSEDAIMCKKGSRIIIEPAHSIADLLLSELTPIDDYFGPIDDPPPVPVRL